MRRLLARGARGGRTETSEGGTRSAGPTASPVGIERPTSVSGREDWLTSAILSYCT